mmetsp:Transcript_28012/g.65699  ORF Transcript_28012/g.65699 Transcript_28012/m.65699 type:complete len:790 (-) Transcript_28012:257-2626(-)
MTRAHACGRSASVATPLPRHAAAATVVTSKLAAPTVAWDGVPSGTRVRAAAQQEETPNPCAICGDSCGDTVKRLSPCSHMACVACVGQLRRAAIFTAATVRCPACKHAVEGYLEPSQQPLKEVPAGKAFADVAAISADRGGRQGWDEGRDVVGRDVGRVMDRDMSGSGRQRAASTNKPMVLGYGRTSTPRGIPETAAAPNSLGVRNASGIPVDLADAVKNSEPWMYKTKMCKRWVATGECSYKATCWFAHGPTELCKPSLHQTQPVNQPITTGNGNGSGGGSGGGRSSKDGGLKGIGSVNGNGASGRTSSNNSTVLCYGESTTNMLGDSTALFASSVSAGDSTCGTEIQRGSVDSRRLFDQGSVGLSDQGVFGRSVTPGLQPVSSPGLFGGSSLGLGEQAVLRQYPGQYAVGSCLPSPIRAFSSVSPHWSPVSASQGPLEPMTQLGQAGSGQYPVGSGFSSPRGYLSPGGCPSPIQASTSAPQFGGGGWQHAGAKQQQQQQLFPTSLDLPFGSGPLRSCRASTDSHRLSTGTFDSEASTRILSPFQSCCCSPRLSCASFPSGLDSLSLLGAGFCARGGAHITAGVTEPEAETAFNGMPLLRLPAQGAALATALAAATVAPLARQHQQQHSRPPYSAAQSANSTNPPSQMPSQVPSRPSSQLPSPSKGHARRFAQEMQFPWHPASDKMGASGCLSDMSGGQTGGFVGQSVGFVGQSEGFVGQSGGFTGQSGSFIGQSWRLGEGNWEARRLGESGASPQLDWGQFGGEHSDWHSGGQPGKPSEEAAISPYG